LPDFRERPADGSRLIDPWHTPGRDALSTFVVLISSR
jgi:hypothetical protein